MSILDPTYSMQILSVEPLCRGFILSCIPFPLSFGMLLARDLIVSISIPSSISLPASLFTRYVIQDLVANSLVTLLERLVCDVVLPSGPRDTSPSHGVTNPSLDPC